MILSCPKCAARYAVDTDQIPPGGRTVRCATCRHKWRARREDAESGPWDGGLPDPAGEEDFPEVADLDIPDPTPSEPVPDAFPDVDPVLLSRPRGGKSQKRTGPPPLLIWAAVAAVLALLALAAAVFRNPIVRLWPKTAAVYAAVGVSVNGLGLVIEDVRLSPAVQNGQAILGISGRIRNERDRATPAAPLRITLLSSAGAPLASLVSKPLDTLPPLQSRYFQVVVKNPPPGVASAALSFVSHAPEAGKPNGAGHPAPAAEHAGAGPAESAAPAAPHSGPDAPETPPPPGAAPPVHE